MAGEGRKQADCYERALRLLAARPHFRAELERKLEQRDYAATEIHAALNRLAKLGYLDDDKAAAAFVQARRRRRLEGPRRLRAELQRRGADGESIDRVLEEHAPAAEEPGAAKAAAERWLHRHALREPKDRAALARHLSRQGFGSAVIVETLRDSEPH